MSDQKELNRRLCELGRRRDRNIVSIQGQFTISDVVPFFLPDGAELLIGDEHERVLRKVVNKARTRCLQLCNTKKLVDQGRVQLAEFGTKPVRVFAAPAYRSKRDWVAHDLMMWKYLRTLPNA